jgi:hypothetical protein
MFKHAGVESALPPAVIGAARGDGPQNRRLDVTLQARDAGFRIRVAGGGV